MRSMVEGALTEGRSQLTIITAAAPRESVHRILRTNPVSYDNLFYADGSSPQTCTIPPPGDYGGYFDNYGVMLTLANGDVVDLYSNGDTLAVSSDPNNPAPPLSPAPFFYGVVVIANGVTDYTSAGGLALGTPEPSTWAMMLAGFAGLGFAGYRSSRKRAAVA